MIASVKFSLSYVVFCALSSYTQKRYNGSDDWMISEFEIRYYGELRVRTSAPGAISSPGYPDPLIQQLIRTWSIVAPYGNPSYLLMLTY